MGRIAPKLRDQIGAGPHGVDAIAHAPPELVGVVHRHVDPPAVDTFAQPVGGHAVGAEEEILDFGRLGEFGHEAEAPPTGVDVGPLTELKPAVVG